jgi:hypothetical protein
MFNSCYWIAISVNVNYQIYNMQGQIYLKKRGKD